MSTDIDLGTVERSIYKYFWEDGLIDLLLGVGLTFIGLAWLSGLVGLTILVPVILLPVWMWTRKNVTVPRAGHVVFTPEQTMRTHQNLNTAGLVGFGLLTLFGALYVYVRNDPSSGGEWIEHLIPGLPAALLAAGLVVTYLAFKIPRFVAHAGILIAMAVIGASADVDPGWQFLIAGVIITTLGTARFISFLRDFPESSEEHSETEG